MKKKVKANNPGIFLSELKSPGRRYNPKPCGNGSEMPIPTLSLWRVLFHRQPIYSRVATTGISVKHFCILATSWIRCTCTNYWPLVRFPMTVGKCNTNQQNHQCLFTYQVETWCSVLAAVTLDKQRSDVCGDDQLSFGTSSGDGVHVHEKWELHHSDQANTSQVYPCTNVCQINESWKQDDNYSLDSFYNAQ